MPRGDFGGIKISFKKYKNTPLKKVFGTKPMSPPEMMKAVWAFIKKKKLTKTKKKKK